MGWDPLTDQFPHKMFVGQRGDESHAQCMGPTNRHST